MTQSKNKKNEPDERIRIHGIVASIEVSGRGYVIGYVIVRALSEEREPIAEYMNDDLAAKISAMTYEEHFAPWKAEMQRLREVAIKRARKEWRPSENR